MGSWPYGLDLILTWGTVPQGGWRLGLHGLGVISYRGKRRVAWGVTCGAFLIYFIFINFFIIFLFIFFSLFNILLFQEFQQLGNAN